MTPPPTYKELLEIWKETHKAAIAVSDKLTRHTDHVVYDGGTEIVDHLRDILAENDHIYNDLLYGDKPSEEPSG